MGILRALGGIDFVLAYFLQQNVLNQKSLGKIKKIMAEILASKYQVLAAKYNDMLDEINIANKKQSGNLANDDTKSKEAVFGQQQSPINIISTYMDGRTVKMSEEDFAANPLKFSYPQIVRDCTIENNGYTVQVNIAPSNKCTLSIRGKTYDLKQFHFHTPSEHMIDSKKHDMEMHLVHANEKGELAVLGFIFSAKAKYQRPKLELTQSRAHLVLSKESMVMDTENAMKSIPDEESDDLDTDDEWDGADEAKIIKLGNKRGNDFLAQFFDQLPAQKTDCDIILKKPLSFDYLFETSSKKFSKNLKTNEIDIEMDLFEYDGSLTTPPYSEGVQWLIPTNIQFMSTVQLKDLSACWNNKNNARPVQDYCKRIVQVRSKSSMQVV